MGPWPRLRFAAHTQLHQQFTVYFRHGPDVALLIEVRRYPAPQHCGKALLPDGAVDVCEERHVVLLLDAVPSGQSRQCARVGEPLFYRPVPVCLGETVAEVPVESVYESVRRRDFDLRDLFRRYLQHGYSPHV